MKRFFVFVIFLIGLTSVDIKAQTVRQSQDQYAQQDEYTQTRLKCYQAEIQKALEEEATGRTVFFVGLGLQVAGGGLMLLSSDVESMGLTAIGGMICAGGTICEIVGVSKWYSSAIKIRNLSLSYGITNNGVGTVIVF